jgi:hypothetical protein
MAEDAATFETKFDKWNKYYKGHSSKLPYRIPKQGSHLIASVSHPEIQYDARDVTFIRRTAKDSDEIKEDFKPNKGVDAAVFFKTTVGGGSEELRADTYESCLTRLEQLQQKRADDALPYIHEFDDLQKQLLEAIGEWRNAKETAVKVQAALRVGELQKQLADVEEKRSTVMFPHTRIVAYKPETRTDVRKKTAVEVWTQKTAAGEEEAPAAAPKKSFGAVTADKSGYLLVRSATNAVDRSVPLA